MELESIALEHSCNHKIRGATVLGRAGDQDFQKNMSTLRNDQLIATLILFFLQILALSPAQPP